MLSPFRLVLCFVPVTILVWLLLPQLSTDFLPKEKTTSLTVSFALPNSSPDIVEQQATSLLEGTFSQLRHLKRITSVSDYNSGSVKLYFDRTTNMQMNRFEVLTLIRQVYTQLPATASYPIISGSDHSGSEEQSPLLSYSINAPLQPFKIKQVADAIFRKALANITGIKEIKISGTENFNICIYFDKDRCRALQIDAGLIGATVQNNFSASYPGFLAKNGEQYFIKINASQPSITSLGNIILRVNESGTLYLKDVASIYLEEQAPSYYYRINGKNSVNLNIYAYDKENKIVLGKQVKPITDSISRMLPQGYEIRLEHDETDFLQKEITKSYRRIILSVVILLSFISLTYRNLRYTANLIISLSASVFLTLLFIWLLHIDIHIYTLAGLAISFGISTDNAIVMLDYYHRTRSKKIFTALLGANIITISALCLIFFLPEKEQNNLTDFSIVVMLALVSSLIVAIWVTPALHELLFYRNYMISGSARIKRTIFTSYFSVVNRIAIYKKTFLLLLVLAFGVPVFMLPPTWKGMNWYHKWYNAVFDNDYFKENIRPQIDSWSGGMLYVFVKKVYNKSGYRNPEKTKLFINAELPYGHTIGQMNYILGNFEKYLAAVNGIDQYITSVYSGQHGTIAISFKQNDETSALPQQLQSWLIGRSSDWGGVKWRISGAGKGFSNQYAKSRADYVIKMKGYNYDELEKQTAVMAEKLQQNIRVHNVNTNTSVDIADKQSAEYIIQLNNTGMALLSTDKSAITTRLHELATPTVAATQVVIDERFYRVIIKEANSNRFSNYDLLHGYIQTDSAKIIRVNDFGKMGLQQIGSRIHKEDRQYIRMVSFDYMGSAYFGKKFLEKAVKEMHLQLPIGYSAEYDSGNWDWSKDTTKYALIGLLILFIFFICSILFESLRESLFIIIIVPESFIGVFAIFSAGDFYLDQGGYAAFVMLSGLVTNAGIFIITDYKNLIKNRTGAFPKNILLIKAIINRSGTILLTILSTCCGLAPFIIEGNDDIFWFSLAIGTIGGLLFSLFALFIVLPVLLWKANKK